MGKTTAKQPRKAATKKTAHSHVWFLRETWEKKMSDDGILELDRHSGDRRIKQVVFCDGCAEERRIKSIEMLPHPHPRNFAKIAFAASASEVEDVVVSDTEPAPAGSQDADSGQRKS